MAIGNMIGLVKDGLLITTAVGGIMTGFYNYVAKPVFNESRLSQVEKKINELEPSVKNNIISVAVLNARLDSLEKGQAQILDAVLEVKRKL